VLVSASSQPLAAQETKQPAQAGGVSPSYVWLAGSAALLSASLGGVSALRVNALFEQSRTLPSVSPTQLTLKRQAQDAAVSADALFGTALAFGVITVWLALIADWHTGVPADRESAHTRALQLVPLASQRGAGVLLSGAWP
jgi:hypothetical protein